MKEATGMNDPTDSPAPPAPTGYPVTVRATLDEPLSRWLWLVKWLLLIPHIIVLFLLWLAFFVVSVIAFFAILITGAYPPKLFEFNAGVLRWSWRVSYYGYSALGTDHYPPFTLDDVPDYPARLQISYPDRLHRWLPLVKWLLAVPHLLILSAFGGGAWATSFDANHGARAGLSLIAVSVLIAAVSLLFTGRYPIGLFNMLIGLNRWSYRVIAYVALMTDQYPPFRLDQGGEEPSS
jgi:hypothetical protein